jgi:hypothetical protein
VYAREVGMASAKATGVEVGFNVSDSGQLSIVKLITVYSLSLLPP